MPEGVLVGLAVSRRQDRDSIEQEILRDAFQRRAVHLAHSSGGAVAGRVGGHGVVFLVAGNGSSRKRLARLRDLAHEAAVLAKREFAFDLFCGAAQDRRRNEARSVVPGRARRRRVSPRSGRPTAFVERFGSARTRARCNA